MCVGRRPLVGRAQRRDLQLRRAPRRARSGRRARSAAAPTRRSSLAAIRTGASRLPSPGSWGMFALALWDAQERTLHLVRDRLGKKPLYYGWQGDSFLFGSELKALRAHPDFDAAHRPRRARELPALRLRPGPALHLRGHPQAAAGQHLVVRPGSPGRARPSRAGTGTRSPSRAKAKRTRCGSRTTRPSASSNAPGGRGPAPLGRRRAAGRVPVRRHRLLDGGRADAGAEPASASRRSRSASTRASTTSRRTPRPSRDHLGTDHTELQVTPGRDSRGHPAPARDLRRAVRRRLADPDVPGLRAGAPERHGRAVGRRRRRGLRRLQPLRRRDAALVATAVASRDPLRPRHGAARWRRSRPATGTASAPPRGPVLPGVARGRLITGNRVHKLATVLDLGRRRRPVRSPRVDVAEADRRSCRRVTSCRSRDAIDTRVATSPPIG